MIFQQFNLVKRSSVLTNVLSGRLGYLPPSWSLMNYFPRDEVSRAMTNLRRVARELNIGTNALVFVDDHPVERALVRELLPEVAVPEMPADPADFVRAFGDESKEVPPLIGVAVGADADNTGLHTVAYVSDVVLTP